METPTRTYIPTVEETKFSSALEGVQYAINSGFRVDQITFEATRSDMPLVVFSLQRQGKDRWFWVRTEG